MDWFFDDSSPCQCGNPAECPDPNQDDDDIDDCYDPCPLPGIDQELLVRCPPFQNYPEKAWKKVLPDPTKRVDAPIDFKAIVENFLNRPDQPPPKWIPRFCLRRMHVLLLSKGLVPDVEECCSSHCLVTLWEGYERFAADVFVYDEIDLVGNILILLGATCEMAQENSKEIFERMVERLQKGVYLESVSKGVGSPKKLAKFFTVLGLAMVSGHPQCQLSLSSTLCLWLESVFERRQSSDRGCHPFATKLMGKSTMLKTVIPDAMIIQGIEGSMLAAVLGKGVRDKLDIEVDAYVSVLNLMKLCCEASSTIYEDMSKFEMLDSILMRLSLEDPQNKILTSTCDFLQCLFGVQSVGFQTDPPKQDVTVEIYAFQSLMGRLIQQLPLKKLKSTLELRNDTAFIVCLVCNHAPIAKTYLEEYAALIASIIKNAILNIPDESFVFDSSPEDIEFLQYCIYYVKCMAEGGCGENAINEYNLVSVLLMLILGPCGLTKSEEARKGDLDSAAWSAIDSIAKYQPLSLLTQHGATTLLTSLKSFGERGEDDQKMVGMSAHTLRLLLCCTEGDSESSTKATDEVMAYFIERDGMATFLSVLSQLVVKDTFQMSDETSCINLLHCCAALGSDLSQKERFIELDGIAILLVFLKRLSSPFDKRHMETELQAALTECICGCVAYSPAALEEFLTNDAILLLLDLVEHSENSIITSCLLTCILQLCDYPRCMDQLLCWTRQTQSCNLRMTFGTGGQKRSVLDGWGFVPKCGDALQEMEEDGDDKSLASLLCALWKEEEDRLGVLRDPDGCIASITNPLMTNASRIYGGKVKHGIVKACLDFSVPSSYRHKLFVLLKAITELTKTEAILFDSLSQKSQLIMPIILNYDGLKRSEIIIEVIDEMHEEGLVDNSDTAAELTKLLTVSRNKVVTVIELQRYLLRRYKEKECTNEHEFYALIKQCNLQDHLMAATEIDFIARTTNYQFLVEKRLWQKSELDNAANELDPEFAKTSRIHRTSDGNLNITAWTGKTRWVNSEPPANLEDLLLDDYEENEDPGEVPEPTPESDINNNDDSSDGPVFSHLKGSIAVALVHKLSAQHHADEDEDDDAEMELDMEEAEDAEAAAKSFAMSFAIPTEPSENLGGTPDPVEGGFYQVSPFLLLDALEKLEAHFTTHEWFHKIILEDEDYGWRSRLKWKENWYP